MKVEGTYLTVLLMVLGSALTLATDDENVGQTTDRAPEQTNDGKGTNPQPSNSSPAPPTVTSPVPEPLGFTLYNGSRLCFRAVFKAQITVRYYTVGLGTTKVLETTLDLPEKPSIDGGCDQQKTSVSLSWSGGNYTLSLGFTLKVQEGVLRPVSIMMWSANALTFTFDTRDNPEFSDIKIPAVYHSEADRKDIHFEAPSNFSYACQTEENINLHVNTNGTVDQSVIDSVVVSIWDVKIQAFELPQNGAFGESASCKPDIDKNIPQRNIAPIVTAACLAAIILIIIIAYYFIKNKQKTKYSAME